MRVSGVAGREMDQPRQAEREDRGERGDKQFSCTDKGKNRGERLRALSGAVIERSSSVRGLGSGDDTVVGGRSQAKQTLYHW